MVVTDAAAATTLGPLIITDRTVAQRILYANSKGPPRRMPFMSTPLPCHGMQIRACEDVGPNDLGWSANLGCAQGDSNHESSQRRILLAFPVLMCLVIDEFNSGGLQCAPNRQVRPSLTVEPCV
jgi:hypothetical protein